MAKGGERGQIRPWEQRGWDWPSKLITSLPKGQRQLHLESHKAAEGRASPGQAESQALLSRSLQQSLLWGPGLFVWRERGDMEGEIQVMGIQKTEQRERGWEGADERELEGEGLGTRTSGTPGPSG